MESQSNSTTSSERDLSTSDDQAETVTPDTVSEQDSSDELFSDDSDDDHIDYEHQILNSYRRLLSRRVDLVGDYAGDELFLIEGDSILLRCFSDDKLDFSPGFQMLHATYSVEQFLHHLAKRKCNFHVAFFDCNRQLCVPLKADEADYAKYYLARAAIIRHLQANLAKSHPEIQIHTFDSYESEDFTKYLESTTPYFFMSHDGAQAIDRTSKFIQDDSTTFEPSHQRVALREMILSFIGRGYNVALVNGLEWRDTKVMTMVLEERRRTPPLTVDAKQKRQVKTSTGVDVSADIFKLPLELRSALTERQMLAACVVGRLIQCPPADVDAEAWQKLCSRFLLHEALLAHLSLRARRLIRSESTPIIQGLMRGVAVAGESFLSSASWKAAVSDCSTCDVVDLVDGRLLLQVSLGKSSPPDDRTRQLFERLAEAVHIICGTLPTLYGDAPQANGNGKALNGVAEGVSTLDFSVLPFSNPVFDKHLESVRLDIDEAAAGEQSRSANRIFREVTHWHNAKKPIVIKGPATPADAKEAKWAAKRNQWFMAEMRTYAASLTNAVGKSLDPESIIVGGSKSSNFSPVASDSEKSDSTATSSKGKPVLKKGGGGKTAAKNAGKQAMMNQIAAAKAKKTESGDDKIVNAWRVACNNLEAEKELGARYAKTKDYIASLQASWKAVIGAEVELFLLNSLLQLWIEICRRKEQAQRAEVAASIWNMARNIVQSDNGLTISVVSSVEATIKTLGLPNMPLPAPTIDRKLAFTFALPTKVDGLSVKLPSKDFQLMHCGPYLERSFDSAPDSRVEFQPDGWQRRVLDGIDAKQSLFVVAPTSAGKTFISFYAMRKVLEADDESVLVYVAPTKALVNQIAAEIQARYSKKFKYGGKSVWAIHTRDYRINNPTGCQVLVTVPHVLQIMLLAPSHANSWSSRVKRIIFDEVHSIGQAEDGVVWEQLLLLAPCPIIALSATVGNPEEFSSWLTSTQKAIGNDLTTVQHPYRYSDLRKYYYVPPKRFGFQGLPEKVTFGTLGLEGAKGFNHIHPVAGLVDRSRGIPEDLSMEPVDCYDLWRAVVKHQTAAYPIPQSLEPAKFLPEIARKADVLRWERELKDILRSWIADIASPYDKVLHELESSFRSTEREQLQLTQAGGVASSQEIPDSADLVKSTLPLLCRLHAQDALPAILFNYDRHQCEKLCKIVVEQLQEAEQSQRKSGPKWEKTLEAWESWKKAQAKIAAKKPAAKKSSKKGSNDDDEGGEGDRGSKLDQQRDAAGADVSPWDNFDPEAPQDGYHFADHRRLQLSELQMYIRQLGRRNIQQWLIDAITRGIGVHHAGMNRKYRQVVEILFRKGFLRVIIATGTLALGINMPCKTVVFSGDSVFLTALNYRQCAGRAGRRGFDLLGNVVFQGVSRQKVCRLISSRLPDLNGHFPITTTLVLRLFTLLHESKEAKYAVAAINALLSQPRMYMGGASFKDQTMHHLRFSIEYLRRQYLLDSRGATLNFAGLVSHLYFTENSSFAYHALLKEGYFHELCANIDKDEQRTVETLMLVMAHLFNRIYCRQSDAEYREKVVRPSSSIVFLPPMPSKAAKILRDHNQQTLQIYKTYVETFIAQHVKDDDDTLPLSGMKAGGSDEQSADGTVRSLPPAHVRSAFVALSGAGDKFDTIHDLCHTTREGVFLEEAVIPHVDVYPDETDTPLNAWLLDFLKHGDIMTIERANGVRRADIWFLLNDFSLVLATIITSLMNFMKLKPGSDLDMLDVMGNLDAHEEAEDDKAADAADTGEPGDTNQLVVSDASIVPERPIVAKKKAKNVESWEDVADEEDAAVQAEARRAERKAKEKAALEAEAGDTPAWEEGDGSNEGLRNVLKAMQKLHVEFNTKFKAMWA